MIENTESLIRLALPVVNVLADEGSVAGVLCIGSRALGLSDADSDVDLLVVGDLELAAGDRKALWQSMPDISHFETNAATPGWENGWDWYQDRFRHNGILFDLVYLEKEWLVSAVQQVLKNPDVSISEMPFRPYTLLGLLDHSVILYDPHSVMAEIKSHLRPYPQHLRKKLLAESRAVMAEAVDELQDNVRREIGTTAFLFHLSRLNDAVATFLFALNETYNPCTRRVEAALKNLPILPADFLPRYTRLLQGPFDPAGKTWAVEEYRQLIQELQTLACEV